MKATAAEQQKYLPWGDPAFFTNPYPWFERLRTERPLFLTSEGVYVVTRYKDIIEYGRSPSITIINPQAAAFYDGFAHTMLGMEPPQHSKTRARTNKWFTPKLCSEWVKPGIDAVNAALDNYREGDIIDGHHKLGMIPAHAAMCKALQVPANDPEPAIVAMLAVMRGASVIATSADDVAAAQGFAYLKSRVLELLEYKKAHPGDGLADALIEAQAKGEISTDELLQTLSLFWGSGAHNPSYLIGAALEYFANHPAVFVLYREQPEKRKVILNELLRLHPAELAMTRYAAEEFEMLGTRIPKGSQIRFMLNSGNRDPQAFPNPDELDVDRPLSPANLTFGLGHHGCAGTMISRVEAEAFLTVVALRVRRIMMAGESSFDVTDRSRAYLKQHLRLELI